VSLRTAPESLKPEGATAADWDDDGDLDLYCASHLFVNDGLGRFTDVRAAVGLPVGFDEGAMFLDYDNDGISICTFETLSRGGCSGTTPVISPTSRSRAAFNRAASCGATAGLMSTTTGIWTSSTSSTMGRPG